jgi:hypothetical protein
MGTLSHSRLYVWDLKFAAGGFLFPNDFDCFGP